MSEEQLMSSGTEARYLQMTQTPLPRLIGTMAVPTVISMMVTAIYNLADTYFVSQLGTSASGAVGIAFSLMAMFQAIGYMLGMGAGTTISQLLGQQKRKEAEQVAAASFFTALFLGVILMVVGLIFLDPLVKMLGATPTIFPYARDYTRYILVGAPYIIGSFVLNCLLRAQGSPYFAMVGITLGGVLNVVLDPIFIFTMGMGTGGAALATILSQFVSFLVLYFYSMGRRGNLAVRLRNLCFNGAIYARILRVGLPSFCRQGLASISVMLLNLSAAPFGDAAISAMSIVNRVMILLGSALIGFGQGFQPVCGFNYGAKRYDRVLGSFWFYVKMTMVITVLIGGTVFFIAPQVVGAFRRDDLEVIAIGTLAIRMQCVMLPFQGWGICCNMMAQSLAQPFRATILATARQGLFFIPFIIALPQVVGVLGLQLAQPLADFVTALLALWLGLLTVREITALKNQQLDPSQSMVQGRC
ncbi:MAG: MATE family efflux transporter [Oscillospiraceae bacterium]